MKYCLFLLALFACQQRPSVFTGEPNNGEIVLDAASGRDSLFIGILADLAPGQQLVDTSFYDGLWWSFHSRNAKPNLTVLDINNDGVADCALFVLNQNFVQLKFIISQPNNRYIVVESDFKVLLDGNRLQYGLQIEAPGRIDRIIGGEDRSLELKTNAIVLMHLERALKIYYWDQNGLLSFAMQ